MKRLLLTALFFLLAFIVLNAQPHNKKTIPEGFAAGFVVTPDNATLEGHIKSNMKKNGEIIFLSPDGKKTKYNALQLSAVTIDNNHFIGANNAFYKIVTDGLKIKLLRKASQSSGIAYNGSEPIAVNSGEGAYDDYFIQTVSTEKLQLVSKKDFQKIFASACADCTILADES